jgi:ribonucleoside-diphosphate reductase beta chain
MSILTPGLNLKMRPMQYPQFYDLYKLSIKNTWSIEEVSFQSDISDIRDKLTVGEKHVLNRVVSFFAVGDLLVLHNTIRNLSKHINSPEALLYYSRQIFEESLHQDFYNTLLDNYVPDMSEREKVFDAMNALPSVRAKAEFCLKWFSDGLEIDILDTDEKKQKYLLNMITFASAIEGLQFMASFLYVFWLRSRGLMNGLADGTQWVFRDETLHMSFAFNMVDVIKNEYTHLWTHDLEKKVVEMLKEAISVEMLFAKDVLSEGAIGLSVSGIENYLKFMADKHLERLGINLYRFNGKNEFPFMILQDLEEMGNFFERKVSQYQVGFSSSPKNIEFNADF